MPQGPLAPELLGLVQHVAAYERLAAEAAVSADREMAAKAMLAHPLVGQWPLSRELLDRMLEAELGAEARG
jgi:6-phospho-beta-glucosidase